MPITLNYRESQLYQKGWEERNEQARKDREQARKDREVARKDREQLKKLRVVLRRQKENERIMKEKLREEKEKEKEKEKENTQFNKRNSIQILLRKNADIDLICEVFNVSKDEVMEIHVGLGNKE